MSDERSAILSVLSGTVAGIVIVAALSNFVWLASIFVCWGFVPISKHGWEVIRFALLIGALVGGFCGWENRFNKG